MYNKVVKKFGYSIPDRTMGKYMVETYIKYNF